MRIKARYERKLAQNSTFFVSKIRSILAFMHALYTPSEAYTSFPVPQARLEGALRAGKESVYARKEV